MVVRGAHYCSDIAGISPSHISFISEALLLGVTVDNLRVHFCHSHEIKLKIHQYLRGGLNPVIPFICRVPLRHTSTKGTGS